jgi:electron transfer flavoprotein alpha subunit
MRVLIYSEIHQNIVSPTTRELVTSARRLAGAGGRVEALLAHVSAEDLAKDVGSVDEVIAVKHEALAQYNPEAHLAALVAAVAVRKPDLVLLAYTSAGLDLGPALSARLGWPMASYCTSAELTAGEVVTSCQIYGGKLTASISLKPPAVIMMTPGAAAEDTGPAPADVTTLSAPAFDDLKVRIMELAAPDEKAIDLTKATQLVCVGRGIGDKDSINEAADLAALLGAEIAGSRPVIDAGWLPKERQVGKSGRKVKPRLYLALGVSGAPEHVEGMGSSDLIIAINTDAKAPIFSYAHYGATLDLFDFIEAMKKRLAK